jgi:hypothetical protein
MGNVLRILGVIAASLVMGLAALVLLLFTVCGGFRNAGAEEGLLVAVCVALMLGGVGAIVWLGRGLVRAQPERPGLAVPPVRSMAAAPAPRPRLRGAEFQWLVLLRIAVGGYAFLIFGSTVLSYASMMQIQAPAALAIPMFAGAVVGMLPFILALLLLRDPPSALVLDATAGIAAGSMVFRILWSVVMSLAWQVDAMTTPAMLSRLVVFSGVEAGIVVLALRLRLTIEPAAWGRLVAIGVAFACWEWISQTLVGLLYRVAY